MCEFNDDKSDMLLIDDIQRWKCINRTSNFRSKITVNDVTSRFSFYSAMSRFACMPHIINSRVLSAQLINSGTETSFLDKPILLTELDEVDNKIFMNGTNVSKEGSADDSSQNGYFIVRRKIIAKTLTELISLEIWDFTRDIITLHQPVVVLSENEECSNFVIVRGQFFQSDASPYVVIEIKANLTKERNKEILNFYECKVVPKISQWMMEERFPQNNSNSHIPKCSLQLIERSQYWNIYQSLKQYYSSLNNMWTALEESTDPQKMIHEEMGITAYLLTLWQFSKMEKKSFPPASNFIDLGCGNGLLSLFLTLSGLSGRGIDMRKRKIWALIDDFAFSVKASHLNLSETTILPGTTVFCHESPNTWLLGNHSDELTPWIPIWARQNNFNFFVLPCCPYDFSGKFQRPKGGKTLSIFACYILYIKEIIENCGYKCYIDRLQIPSTKRICLIGHTQYPNDKDQKDVNDYIEAVIKEHGNAFKIRESHERVQNCTKLKSDDGSDVVGDMAKCVLNKLVSEKNYIQEPEYIKAWNQGMEKLSLKDAVNLLTEKHKELMKRQGNGVQTLMKNHSQVFKVINGFVSLRPPSKTDILNVNPAKFSRINSKRCFLELNHPDGCPLSDKDCPYKHHVTGKHI